MSSELKLGFDEKIKQLRYNQGKNVRMFSEQEYYNFIKKLKDKKSPGHRMVPDDLYQMKRF